MANLGSYPAVRVSPSTSAFREDVSRPSVAFSKAHGVNVDMEDERTAGKGINASFQAELRPDQQDAVRQILSYDQGILSAPTAFGKTIVGAYLIAKRAMNTLILVHRRQLMDQWRERLAAFLGVPIGSIGQFGGGKANRTRWIDVAVIQSLHRKGAVEDFVAECGHVIVDECHHLSAVTFERVLREVKARFVLGLTATFARKDGHHPIIHMQCAQSGFTSVQRKLQKLHLSNTMLSCVSLTLFGS